MKDVMIDLETLGTVPGCSILSIGAVAFDEFGVSSNHDFYTVINRKSCLAAGLKEDAATLAWWDGRDEAARKVLAEVEKASAPSLGTALQIFGDYLNDIGNVRVWGNGADFDNPIIAVACAAVGLKQPWPAYNGRCYRTVKAQYKDVKLVRSGTYHHALDDARCQAEHLVQICQTRGWRLA